MMERVASKSDLPDKLQLKEGAHQGSNSKAKREMMINKSKVGFMAAVTLLSIATPAFSWTGRTAPHRHVYNLPDPPVYDQAPDPGVARPSNPADKPSDPVDNPTTSGGGSMGFNKYMGHAH